MTQSIVHVGLHGVELILYISLWMFFQCVPHRCYRLNYHSKLEFPQSYGSKVEFPRYKITSHSTHSSSSLDTQQRLSNEMEMETEECCWNSIPKDVWRSIFERLSPAELGRSACVCRMWRAMAGNWEVQINAFKTTWKLKEVVGRPSSSIFWHHTTSHYLSRFAISHKLKRSDTMAALALKYEVHVTDIKRLNNMMSDHGIYSRDRLLIPVSKPDILIGGTCYIEMDVYAKREVAVLYLNGAPDGKYSYLANSMPEKSKRRLLESMKRCLQTDDGTADYYLAISNGDLRTAFARYSEDLKWEQRDDA